MTPRTGTKARTTGSWTLSGFRASKKIHPGSTAKIGTKANTTTQCPTASAVARHDASERFAVGMVGKRSCHGPSRQWLRVAISRGVRFRRRFFR